MLKNILVEKILCERYKKINNCECSNIENYKLNEDSVVELLYWLTRGGTVPLELAQFPFRKTHVDKPDLMADKKVEAETSSIPISPDFNKPSSNPRTARVKEFGNAIGQVISPG